MLLTASWQQAYKTSSSTSSTFEWWEPWCGMESGSLPYNMHALMPFIICGRTSCILGVNQQEHHTWKAVHPSQTHLVLLNLSLLACKGWSLMVPWHRLDVSSANQSWSIQAQTCSLLVTMESSCSQCHNITTLDSHLETWLCKNLVTTVLFSAAWIIPKWSD